MAILVFTSIFLSLSFSLPFERSECESEYLFKVIEWRRQAPKIDKIKSFLLANSIQ